MHRADDRPASRDTRELEAEAVAFIVTSRFGLSGASERRRGEPAQAVVGQNEAHRPFGGVVPEVAARAHIESLNATAGQAGRPAARRKPQPRQVQGNRASMTAPIQMKMLPPSPVAIPAASSAVATVRI